jgi:glutaredoxin
VITLFDAPRCPYCARVRIALAEKGVEYETVEIDLSDRPGWLYEKNPLGKVPVLEEDDFILPESHLINEYLEERYPEPALLPADLSARARIRLLIDRFDVNLGDAYYAFRRGEDGGEERLAHCLGRLEQFAQRSPTSRTCPGSSAPGTCSASTCHRTRRSRAGSQRCPRGRRWRPRSTSSRLCLDDGPARRRRDLAGRAHR